MPDRYHDTVRHSSVETNEAKITAAVEKLIADHRQANHTREALTTIWSCLDLTSLSPTDTPEKIERLAERVNDFEEEYGELPSVASICVFPNFATILRSTLEVTSVAIDCVAGGFPSSQTFPEVKIAETALAVEAGANEIDTVIDLGNFLAGNWEEVSDDLEEIKHSCREARMKVILETGALVTPEKIRDASILALYSGADFIKTSTGKEYPGATPQAVWVMAQCIKEYFKATGRKVGLKVSGGVSTVTAALTYYTIVKEVLGDEWLQKDLFRIGTSRLANPLLSEILDQPISWF